MKAKTVQESLNEERVSSKGKKTDAVLQFIGDAGPEGRGYTEIIRFAYEYSYGPGTYDADNTPTKTQKYTDPQSGKEYKYRSGGGNPHRGYWSGGFKTPSPDARTFGHLMKYIIKNDEDKWVLRDEVMTDDEAEFHGRRINYGDSEYKPELYKGKNIGGNKDKEIYLAGQEEETWEEDFTDEDTGEVSKITRRKYK